MKKKLLIKQCLKKFLSSIASKVNLAGSNTLHASYYFNVLNIVIYFIHLSESLLLMSYFSCDENVLITNVFRRK